MQAVLAGENPEPGKATIDERNKTCGPAKAAQFHGESIHRAHDGSSHIHQSYKTQGHLQNNLLSKHNEVSTATELICSSSPTLSMGKGVADDERAERDVRFKRSSGRRSREADSQKHSPALLL